ncbi:MAG: acyl-CoA thioesterase [Pseudomonadota bacterium]
MSTPYTLTITASPSDIDELGHVNNAVWVRWIQDVSTAHWLSLATPEQNEAYIWIVTRHEIDYRGNISVGESVTARTWLSEMPRGARFNRNVDFVAEDGKTIVTAKTAWALADRESGRLLRIRADIIEPFMA